MSTDNNVNATSKSRREFLAAGLLAGLAAGCGSNTNPFTPAEGQSVAASGEKVKLLSVDGEIIEIDKAFLKPVPDLPAHYQTAKKEKEFAGKKFVMVIDLSRCKNLKKCQAACNHAHSCSCWTKLDKSIPHAGCRTYQRLTGNLPPVCIVMNHLV